MRETSQPVIPIDTVGKEHLLFALQTLRVWLEGGGENTVLYVDLVQTVYFISIYTYSVLKNLQIYHLEIFTPPDFLL